MAEIPVAGAQHPSAHLSHATPVTECVYLGRQPILARNGALEAYELLFRTGFENRAAFGDHDQASARVVANTIGGFGVAAALGVHRGYINLSRELLFDDIVMLLPPQRFILEVLETVRADAALIERLKKLRRAGFRIALDDIADRGDERLTLLPYIDIVKVDFLLADREALPALAHLLRESGKQLVAEKIETREDFEFAQALGFDLFQGYFFARPQVLSARRSDPSRQSLLRVLALIASDAPFAELELELKRNPDVVMQLLRLVNSSAFGLGRRIASVREAILAAGTRQVARWAQLLLYASHGELPWRSDPLMQLAGTRSRFMELAAGHVRAGDERFVDAAFMTGIFSLVPTLFDDTNPADALGRLGLVPEISDAIVNRTGMLGALLSVAEAAERGYAETVVSGASDVYRELTALTPAALADLNLSAAAWFASDADV